MSDTLLLNTDGRPTSILPLSIVSWQDAIKYLVSDNVRVLEYYEDWTVRSLSWETQVPAILMLKEYKKTKHRVRLTRRNIFLRDLYKCTFCNTSVDNHTATLDHVYPESLGGEYSWTNLTTACSKCNVEKAHHFDMKPLQQPYKPSYWELVNNRFEVGIPINHPSWELYLRRN